MKPEVAKAFTDLVTVNNKLLAYIKSGDNG